MKHLLFFLVFSIAAVGLAAQPAVPDSCSDGYCQTVRRLERGDTAVDYAAFRSSFLESGSFLQAKARSAELGALLTAAERYWHLGNPKKVIENLQGALQIDYTSMAAHSRMGRAYLELGDTVNALRHKAIESGLLQSILAGGDGRSCATAWPVIQVEEEYFVLQTLHAHLQRQRLVTKDGLCDRMETLEGGRRNVYYFEVTKVFDGYDK